MSVSIYTAYHKTAPRIEGGGVIPIHVGAARAKTPLPEMPGDDQGENISDRNGAWCELTALYWAWKNDRDSTAIGLMHYRRLLDISGRAKGAAVEENVRFFDTEDWLAEVDFEAAMAECDVLVPRLHQMGRTVEANFAHGHNRADWDATREIVARDHPDYLESFDAVARSRRVRLGNMAVMKRPIFERYCDWLFDILFKLESAPLDRSGYTAYQSRYIGFMAERLLTVFVHHLQVHTKEVRIREVSILNLSQALVAPYIGAADAPQPGTVNIAFAADRGFLPHAAVMLRSLCDRIDPSRPVNLFFLSSGIDAAGLHTLEMMLQAYPQVRLHPLDTTGIFDGGYRSGSRAPSNATYDRFLLFSLLPGVERLLYLDADLIVRRDICDLYDTDLGGAQLGAVPDWIMTRTLTGPVRTVEPSIPDLGTYQRDTLGLTDEQRSRYFNAGVLLFDFAAMKDPRATGRALAAEAMTERFLFRDQDILNRHFKDSYVPVDARWNVFNSWPQAYDRVPVANHAKAMTARQDPWIVHFADRFHKPWNEDAVPRGELYWETLMRTPFVTEVLNRAMAGAPQSLRRQTNRIVRAGHAFADRVPVLRGPLLRLYAMFK